MPEYFGERSLKELATCDERLQRLFRAVLDAGYDHVILCGHRNEAEQDYAVATGHSRTPWPTSKHNSLPSQAVDVWPWPRIDWNDKKRIDILAEVVKEQAAKLGIKIRWGGDFEHFKDLDHFELAGD